MEITYFGHSCFKIKTRGATLVVDPFDPVKMGVKLPKLEADALLITHDHFDHNFRDGVAGYRIVIDGPGEYEVGGVNIFGIATGHDDAGGKERGKNTMYYVETAGESVLHCGDLGHVLDEPTLGKFGQVTVLLIPVGGIYTIDAEKATKVISSIEPAYVVPMHYRLAGSKFTDIDGLEKFLDEMGIENGSVRKVPLLKISEADNENETRVVALEWQ